MVQLIRHRSHYRHSDRSWYRNLANATDVAGHWFGPINTLILTLFVLEAILKILAEWPKPSRYFKDG